MSTETVESGSPEFSLANYQPKLAMRLISWSGNHAGDRVWKKDATFWPQANPNDVATRLGWLTLPETMAPQAADLRDFAQAVRADGFEHVVLFGMGGSSLAPEVFARTFGPAPGFPDLTVLDSTHPAAVTARVPAETLGKTLFVVSSKSGTTLEPNAFFRYAWAKAGGPSGSPGKQFIAITDPGTPLAQLAEERHFRRCFLATPDVGGRYSALTAFGMVPFALLGHDPAGLLSAAGEMARWCGPSVPVDSNPGLRLGAALGELTVAHRDKVVFVTSPGIRAFPSWVEQLIAESLGKQGRGIVPVPSEPNATDPMGRRDMLLVRLRMRGEQDPATESALDAASHAGVPVLRFEVDGPLGLGPEIFRWEFAIAVAGAIIGVNPFDQPDVELAKELARQAMRGGDGSKAPAPPDALSLADPATVPRLTAWIDSARAGDYIAIQAFLAPTESVAQGIEELAVRLRARSALATTFGFGPRFQHSTGQMHKGGPPIGLFLQLTDLPTADVEVPEMSISFARILAAQAAGDAQALAQKAQRIVRVNVGADAATGLRALATAFGP